MFHRTLVYGLVAGVALMGLPAKSRATHGHGGAAAAPVASAPVASGPVASSAPAGGCGPVYTTVTVYEQVPETYTATRTVYRTEHVNETYTAYRHECVPEQRQVTRYVSRQVQEVKTITVNNWQTVQTTEMRNVTKRVPVCKQVTTITRKCVDNGCWVDECVETFASKLKGKFADECNPHCPQYRTRKVWQSNKQWIEVPCTKTVKTWECVTECVPVTVCKKVCVPETRQVTCCRTVCEPVTETVTVNVSRCVPYTATRCVAKCVPVCENYTATRYVCRAVQKQVACAPAANACNDACSNACDDCGSGRGFGGRLRGLFAGFGGGFGHKAKGGCGCH
ncbi:MAG: hypothetical protein K2W96_20600 [Gemmataceae bacterium]|nr:hypothetical protein [Gemmataceae bacterium]